MYLVGKQLQSALFASKAKINRHCVNKFFFYKKLILAIEVIEQTLVHTYIHYLLHYFFQF